MEQVTPNVQRSARIAYICFLIWGIFVAILEALEYGTIGRPLYERQGWGMGIGILGGIPAVIALIVGITAR